jgi:hypothetical protein
MKSPVYILIMFLWIASCNPAEPAIDALFSLLPPSSTKVDFTNRLIETEEFNMIEYLYFNNGGGVAAGDINNDGLVDLYFTSNQQSNRLYLNKGDLRFEEISQGAGVAGNGDWSTGVSMADVNGDGWLDIYVCQVGNYKGLKGRNQLFLNQGDLTFKEVAAQYGLDFEGFSTQSAFFDYDLDGDLDMYLLNHSVHTSQSYGSADLRLSFDKQAGDRLYRNQEVNGVHVFQDVSPEAGLYSSHIGYGLGITVSDINNDGYPDIYISNDFHENDYLYVNMGDGTFSEQLTGMMSHTSRSSMGNDVGDINNDGLLDVIVLDMLPDDQKILKQSGGEDDPELFQMKLDYGYAPQFVQNTLQLNRGANLFSEIGRLAGIHATDWSWSPLLCDVDNDGWKDLFITSGIYRRANDLDYVSFLTGGNRYFPAKDNSHVPNRTLYEKMPLQPDVNHIFRNNRDLTFTEMGPSWGMGTADFSNGSTYADLDNDGDLDLVVNNINGPASLYRNNAESLLDHHFLSVVLKGSGLNTQGLGTRITLYIKGQPHVVEQFPTRGFLSSVSGVLHFGLGTSTMLDSIKVRWPDLTERIYYQVKADQQITLKMEEGVPLPSQPGTEAKALTLFSQAVIPGLEFKHREDTFSDQDRERLIPQNLSSEGPALAVGDINGDGLDDLFAGGAKNQASAIFIQQADGSFKSLHVPLLLNDRLTEDVAAALFDADGDGDADLYIVRGGNEYPVGNPMLADRLLINNGSGSFQKSPKGALPFLAHNGSCVRPADYDGDGDMDLFVGSRSVPWAYGLSPQQVLLENDGKGNFREVAGSQINGLKDAGMVSDAEWADIDQDGSPDLVIVGEWMNVMIFQNNKGSFKDITEVAGLGKTSGWWNCIKVEDMDQDGDLDLLAGNYGLNSMLKASQEELVEMYVNDFDNNGLPEQVICSYHNGISYPIASLDELASQINGIGKRYPNYAAFAGEHAQDIFGSEKLGQSYKREAVLFESTLFVNNGDLTFLAISLPVEAQFSSVRDMEAGDFNLDGLTDLILCGNNYQGRPSLGRQDASYGLYLQGAGGNIFLAQPIAGSGLKIHGDSRNIALLESGEKQYFAVGINDDELQLTILCNEDKQ